MEVSCEKLINTHTHNGERVKRTFAFLALAAGITAGCGSNPVVTGKLPATSAADSGEVVIIRARAFIGEEHNHYINVDQENIVALTSGQHARLKLASGEHRVAIRCYGDLLSTAINEAVITHRVAAGQISYFAVKPRFSCASIDPLSEAEARTLLSATSLKPL